MPQLQLPFVPAGTTSINNVWSVHNSSETWTYFQGVLPVFAHPAEDHRSYRMFAAQMVCLGACRQSEIIRTFGVSKSGLNRDVAKYRTGGAEAFFARRRGRGGGVITAENKSRIEALLAQGLSAKEAADELDIKYDTLRKAIQQGRVAKPVMVSKKKERDL